jgi:hypothetical protein
VAHENAKVLIGDETHPKKFMIPDQESLSPFKPKSPLKIGILSINSIGSKMPNSSVPKQFIDQVQKKSQSLSPNPTSKVRYQMVKYSPPSKRFPRRPLHLIDKTKTHNTFSMPNTLSIPDVTSHLKVSTNLISSGDLKIQRPRPSILKTPRNNREGGTILPNGLNLVPEGRFQTQVGSPGRK